MASMARIAAGSAIATKLQKVKLSILLDQPFWATMLLRTPLIETREVPRAATDMSKIYFNPDFVAEISPDECKTVMVHETGHILLKHGLRKQNRVHKIWNRSCDYPINRLCVQAGLKPLDKVRGGWLLDARFDGMGAEKIYNILKQEQEDGGGKGQPGQPGGPPQPGQPGGQGQPDDADEFYSGIGDDLLDVPDIRDPEARVILERQIDQTIAAAAATARAAGKLSGDLEKIIGEMLDPQAPWEQLLHRYATQMFRDQETWNRRNRRFRNVYLPALSNPRMGELVMIGDTSGSVTLVDHAKGATEMGYIASHIRPTRIRMVWADSKVKGEEVFEVGEPIEIHPVGGGGTDMRVPLEYVEQYNPVVVVLITDGYTPWPTEPPPFPLIVCCTTEKDCPWGEVIRI